jgi:D-glycero-alpha-D-manno-heptose 1-phosphate guanylyltransferase
VWLVVNGDSLVFADPRPLIARLDGGRAEVSLLALALDDAGRYGTLEIDANDRLVSFREKRPGAGLVSAGVYAFADAAVRSLPAKRPLSFETDVFPLLASTGRVSVERTAANFLDIGTPESLAQAERFIAENRQELLP